MMAELGCLVCVHASAILFWGSFFRKLGRDGSNERLSQCALHSNFMCTYASGCVHTNLIICTRSYYTLKVMVVQNDTIVAFLVVIKGAVCGKPCSKL